MDGPTPDHSAPDDSALDDSGPDDSQPNDSGLDVSVRGAELQSLTGPDGTAFLHDGVEAWHRHAPFLFPIICRVPGDTVTVDGQTYPMPQHGIVRDRDFTQVAPGRFELVADDSTREHFPFDFRLTVAYAARADGLDVKIDVENTGEVPMPFSFGWHPAFRWPLGDASAEADGRPHVVRFDEPEPEPFHRVVDNLLDPTEHPSLAEDGSVTLERSIFDAGAVVMTAVRSTGLTYEAPDGHGVRIEAEGFSGWTLWSAPDGPFVCLEPWNGLPAPADFVGELRDHPGTSLLAPAEVAHHFVSVTFLR